ncbi:MAG: hypothetical protein JO108_19800 [Acidobacteriaceae bacterium]|nr:hypothetical protein [Acidobacteriaceae bacterium]
MAEPAKLVRVVAAFVGGIVLALGGSLIYVRLHDTPREMVRTAVAVPAAQIHSVAPASDQPPSSHETSARVAGTEPAPVEGRTSSANRSRRRVVTSKTAVIASVRRPESPIERVNPMPGSASSRAAAPAPTGPDPIQSSSPQTPHRDIVEPIPARSDPPPPVYQPHVVTLQPGTSLNIRLGETISTDSSYSGDTFRGVLDLPVIADGFIIADKGSKVLGRVVRAQKAGKLQGTANLSVTLTQINTTDGQQVVVETNSIENRGITSTGQDAAEIAGGAVLGAIIGALAGGGKGAAIGAGAGGAAGTSAVLLTRGKPARLASETRLTFSLRAPVTITEKLNN